MCLRYCCCCCRQYAKDSQKGKYPHILYGQLVQPQDTKQALTGEDETVFESPIQRRYKYPQKYREYTIPPQLDGQEERLIIHEQPRRDSPDILTQDDAFYATSEESLSDFDNNPGVGFVNKGKRPSLSFIERSPESSLKRGEHIPFSSTKGKKMSISVLRPLDPSLLQKLEALKPESSPVLSGVHFSLYFDEHKGMLIIHVDRAVNIPTMRPEITCSPFIQVYLLPSKLEVQQSHSIDDESHNPVFDRMFRFSNIPVEESHQQMLVMRLYINANHFIGGVVYNLFEDELLGNKVVKEIEEYDEEEGLRVSYLMCSALGINLGLWSFEFC